MFTRRSLSNTNPRRDLAIDVVTLAVIFPAVVVLDPGALGAALLIYVALSLRSWMVKLPGDVRVWLVGIALGAAFELIHQRFQLHGYADYRPLGTVWVWLVWSWIFLIGRRWAGMRATNEAACVRAGRWAWGLVPLAIVGPPGAVYFLLAVNFVGVGEGVAMPPWLPSALAAIGELGLLALFMWRIGPALRGASVRSAALMGIGVPAIDAGLRAIGFVDFRPD